MTETPGEPTPQCPFCGQAQLSTIKEHRGWKTTCLGCCAAGPIAPTYEEAEAVFGRRSPPVHSGQEREALRQRIMHALKDWDDGDVGTAATRSGFIADAVLAAGWGRGASPEPIPSQATETAALCQLFDLLVAFANVDKEWNDCGCDGECDCDLDEINTRWQSALEAIRVKAHSLRKKAVAHLADEIESAALRAGASPQTTEWSEQDRQTVADFNNRCWAAGQSGIHLSELMASFVSDILNRALRAGASPPQTEEPKTGTCGCTMGRHGCDEEQGIPHKGRCIIKHGNG